MGWLWALGVLLLLAAIASVAVGYAMFRVATVRRAPAPKKNKPPADPAWRERAERSRALQDAFWAQKPREAHIRSFDGLRLTGYYLPAGDSRRTILLMHGYRCASATGDFAPVLQFYHDLGLNILAIDERAHGASEGKYITFGVNERRDCQAWLEYLNEIYHPTDLFLAGVSMGCATVLMAQGLPLPDNLRGVIADCGFTSPWDICAHVLRASFHLPRWPVMPVANWFCKRLAGFDLKGCSTLDALRECRAPVLFLHGDRDDFVPAEMTRQNYAVCTAPKQLLLVPGAGHAMSLWVDGDALRARIGAFLAEYATC